MYAAHIITDDSITIVTASGEIITVAAAAPQHDKVLECLREGDYEAAVEAATETIDRVSQYGVDVSEGVVYFNGEPLHNAVTERILRMISEGFEDTSPMINFLSNLMENPSARARQELYRFLSSNHLPITSDGYFLAYKNVDDNYRDKHTGTFDNSVGSICEMSRSLVMDDPNVTCAEGLHFCSMEYLNGMWGHSGHTMVVKINPRDVVSIPVDYNNSKGRTCRYEVIAEHKDGQQDTLSRKVVA